MIVIKGREMIIPNDERYIGTNYDESSENRQFLLPRVNASGTDISELTFTLDLVYKDGTKDAMVLEKAVDEENITLTWTITEGQVQQPGTVFIWIRATDSEGTVRWATLSAQVYVDYEPQSYADYTGSLSELEYYEVQYHLWKASEDNRTAAEAEREAFFAQLKAWYEISVEALEDTSIGGMTEVIAETKAALEQEMEAVSDEIDTLANTTVAGIRTDLDALDTREANNFITCHDAITILQQERIFSLPAASWVQSTYNGETAYKQEKVAVGVTGDCSAPSWLSHVSSYTKTQWEQAQEAYGAFIAEGWAETDTGKVTFWCYAEPPYDFVVKTRGI